MTFKYESQTMYEFVIDFIQSMMGASFDASDIDAWSVYRSSVLNDDNTTTAGHVHELTELLQIGE